jgi:hypothetical protein
MPAARARGRTDDEAEYSPPKPKPRSDVYVGLLVVSLLVMIAACAFVWMDYSQYPDSKPPPVPDRPLTQGTTPPGGARPAAPAGAQPANPAGAQPAAPANPPAPAPGNS